MTSTQARGGPDPARPGHGTGQVALPASLAEASRPDRGLPGLAYTSAEVFAWEREHLWDRAWTCLGRADVTPAPHPDLAGCSPSTVRWQGWSWTNIADPLPGPAETFGNLGALLHPYRLPRLRTADELVYEVAANWKLLVENYLECYHCASTHPELNRVQRIRGGEDLLSTGAWLGGLLDLRNSARTMSLDGDGPDWTFPDLTDDRARQVCYHAALPSLFITGLPDYVVCHRLEPIAANRTTVTCTWLFDNALLRHDDPGYAIEFWNTTNMQDWAACESVQRGVSNSRYIPGPLGPQESALGSFLSALGQAYRLGGPLRPRRAGLLA